MLTFPYVAYMAEFEGLLPTRRGNFNRLVRDIQADDAYCYSVDDLLSWLPEYGLEDLTSWEYDELKERVFPKKFF